MAVLAGNLWQYNLEKVVVIDVSDDYQYMQSPLPSDFYPVLQEQWVPAYQLGGNFCERDFLAGYLYDWHETPREQGEPWYVGLVRQEIANPEL